jgi:glutaredoxin 3
LAYGNRATYVDVMQDRNKLQEMLRHSGGARDVPVLVEDGKVTVGYGGT